MDVINENYLIGGYLSERSVTKLKANEIVYKSHLYIV